MNAQNPAQPPLIYSPSKPAPGAVRTLYGVITLIAWIAYAYLWLPVITVLAWMLGIRTTYTELYVQRYDVDRDIFGILVVLAVVATVMLVGWAEYNRHKFGGKDRRAAPSNVTGEDIALAMQASPDVALRMARAKSVTLTMDEHGRPMGIHSDTPLSRLL
jgi:biofilm PGA synthesis protein PgaD